ncbi:hypothetical protein B296_00000536 [Ensete ventricosum]|uniref:Uncharacterized protein n=1 Tax=Ensete ventricosum TaxID=4639 RepID=A0A426ZMV1_ENSVE|nr:hypothetical protein B296_00000536 [Ensete ventricosum]
MVAAGAPRSLSREILFYDDEVLSCRIASGQFHKLNAFLQVARRYAHYLEGAPLAEKNESQGDETYICKVGLMPHTFLCRMLPPLHNLEPHTRSGDFHVGYKFPAS